MYLAKNRLVLALPFILTGIILGSVCNYFYSFSKESQFTATATLALKTSDYEFEGSIEEAVEVLSLEFDKRSLRSNSSLFDLALKADTASTRENQKLLIKVTTSSAESARELANSFSKQAVKTIRNWQNEKQTQVREFLQNEINSLKTKYLKQKRLSLPTLRAQAALE